MNLKESFRYQKFLDNLMSQASSSVTSRDHCYLITKTHYLKKANPDAEDRVEIVERKPFIPNDTCVIFMKRLVEEREKLSAAITKAKASADFDIDAAIEANKFRQTMCNSIKRMLGFTPTKSAEMGRDYKFNVEGNQTPYMYEIETSYECDFDDGKARKIMKELVRESDEVSAKIDAAQINTVVNYEPPFDVNDDFEDAVFSFMSEELEL